MAEALFPSVLPSPGSGAGSQLFLPKPLHSPHPADQTTENQVAFHRAISLKGAAALLCQQQRWGGSRRPRKGVVALP